MAESEANAFQDAYIPGNERGFYEGRWTRTDARAVTLRNILVKKERFFLKHLRGRQGRILDLGCGGGWGFFATLGPVIGLDLSRLSLKNASTIYQGAIQASATALPFADESFDYVVSLDLLGHIPIERKDRLLAEIYRVLKPGGMTLHYIEAASSDPMTRLARRDEELFSHHILLPEGHIGLEPPMAIFSRFRQCGLEPRVEAAVYKGLLYPRRLVQCFDNAYREQTTIDVLVRLCKALTAWGPLEDLSNIATSALFELLDPLLPQDWAGGVLVCYAKPS